jgi:NADH-ubiquinone oxidoreductase chain 5
VLFEVPLHTINKTAHEGDLFLSLPLVILAIFSIFFGYLTKDIFIGLGSNFFIDNSLFIHPIHEIMIDTEFAVPTLFKILPLIFTILFSILAIIFSEFLPELLINFKFSRLGYNIFGYFNQRFLIEMFYNKYITNLILKLGEQSTKILDKGSIELIGPFGAQRGLTKLSKNIDKITEDTNIPNYALNFTLGLILFIYTIFSTSIVNVDINYLVSLVLILFLGFTSESDDSQDDLPETMEAMIFCRNFSTTGSKNKVPADDGRDDDKLDE